MYRFLLAWRYLRTRFIAVASIVSVTLGVATLIVVNAVMAGFVDQMHDRLHGILSDIEVAGAGLTDIPQMDWHLEKIREVAGDDLQAVTAVVRVPALLQYNFRGQPMTHQIMLIGIDDQTFGTVTDFQPYLENALNQKDPGFDLRWEGYPSEMGEAGWHYRVDRAKRDRQLQILSQPIQEQLRLNQPVAMNQVAKGTPDQTTERALPRLPESAPVLPENGIDETQTRIQLPGKPNTSIQAFDSSLEFRPVLTEEDIFDPGRDQYAGIIIGKGIGHRIIPKSAHGPGQELYLLRPGDDIQITLPSAGNNPTPIMENCTVVDFYSSGMHEYDGSFAFMPISHLQKIRGMIDPLNGLKSVSAFQIKLKPGSDLGRVRDKLIAFFPPHAPYVIQTWQDTQRPLLNAVNLELTILNILLFLIIGVAGFGILATFFMIVVEKTKDIGILKSLGATGRGVMTIFLGYGLSLGTVGTGVGIVLGLLFVWNINEIADLIGKVTGTEVYDPMIYFFDKIPTIVSPWMVFWVATGAIMIAVLASVLPAIRAARLHPVEALRYE